MPLRSSQDQSSLSRLIDNSFRDRELGLFYLPTLSRVILLYHDHGFFKGLESFPEPLFLDLLFSLDLSKYIVFIMPRREYPFHQEMGGDERRDHLVFLNHNDFTDKVVGDREIL